MTFLKEFIHNITAPVDTEAGQLINIPNRFIRWSIFMSVNAILQAFADIIIEILILSKVITFKIPFRLEFLFLTVISTVIAYFTLKGLREGNLDGTRNTLILGLLVESSLLLGDVYLLSNTTKGFWTMFAFRIGFMVLTSANIFIVSRLIWKNISIKKSRPNYRF